MPTPQPGGRNGTGPPPPVAPEASPAMTDGDPATYESDVERLWSRINDRLRLVPVAMREPFEDVLLQVEHDLELLPAPDADGASHSLASLKGKNGTVVIFIATKCPVSNAYNDRMEKVFEDYKTKGINVVGLTAGTSTPDTVINAVREQLESMTG